ncbi:MAG: hypothetical protein LUC24_05970 [Bacteroidales bacterium]|nr:hypothetical protein [Bacteroidales bacterium]
MLIQNYYTVDSMEAFEGGATFSVSLDPSCEIYKGHFPERAISPGVCSIRMVTECAELYLTGLRKGSDSAKQQPCSHLRISEIHRCRFTRLITPADTPHLTVRLNLTETEAGYKLKAEISCDETTFLTLDCTLTEE